MNKILYTLGYGLLEGTHAERKRAFQDRLQKTFPHGAVIIDVRTAGSGSRNGVDFRQVMNRMFGLYGLCSDAGCDYWPIPVLANKYGGSQKGLKAYADTLCVGEENEWIEAVCFWLKKSVDQYCLLCGCGEALKPSGARHCHRAPLAEAIVARMQDLYGENLEVWHL